ncbi:MAG TPA: hypothetical protein VJA21_10575 [Verrucomicrobiae bacterium]
MKTRASIRLQRTLTLACRAGLAAVLMMAVAQPVWAGNGKGANPGVIPPQALPNGMTYGQWGAEWWKWVYATPVDQNPIQDPDGRFGSQGQSGQVWFLAGTFGETVVRSMTIPVGKKIFFPLVNYFNDYPCPDPNFQPAPGQTLEQFLTEGAGWWLAHVTNMTVTVDGESLGNLFNYRGTSSLTTFVGDPSWVAMDPCVTGEPQVGVSDGYWIMLAPLPPGQHTIRFTATQYFPAGIFFPDKDYLWNLDVTYHVTVKQPAK